MTNKEKQDGFSAMESMEHMEARIEVGSYRCGSFRTCWPGKEWIESVH